jgi:FKBP-type peptidyl-prolyl cis-trans isomerase SlyD
MTTGERFPAALSACNRRHLSLEGDRMIDKGSKVRFHYTLTVDGEEIESSKGNEPLSYVHGEGQIVPGLEEQLKGMAPGETTSTEIPPEKGYGPPDPTAVQTVPRSAFKDADRLKVGDIVAGEAAGQAIRARIAKVDGGQITIDLNHPLAGKTLQFTIEVVEVA